MKARTVAAPRGGVSLTAGSVLLLAAYFYVFLGAAPVTGVARLHDSFGLVGLISIGTLCTLGHLVIYGALTLGLCAIFKSAGARPAIAATLTGVGVAIEILQEQFFGRQFELTDMAANTMGIAAALILLAVITRRAGRRTHRS